MDVSKQGTAWIVEVLDHHVVEGVRVLWENDPRMDCEGGIQNLELLVLEHAGEDFPRAQDAYLGVYAIWLHSPVHQRPGPVVIPESNV